MLKIKHFHDTNALNSATLSSLALDNDTIVVDASKQEIFRFVKPKVFGTTTFSTWKDNLPKKTYSHLGSTSTSLKGFKDLTSIFSLYDSDAIFISSLSSRFMLNLNHDWQKKIGGAGDEVGRAIAVDSSGNVYLNGHQASDSYGGNDYGVVKLDTNGNLLWQKKIGGAKDEGGRAIAVDSSGNVYLNGSQASKSYGSWDYGVVKLDTHGNLLWQKKIGGASSEYVYAIAVDSSGNVYLNGLQPSDSYGVGDYGVVKLDTNGNVLWQKKIGGAGQDLGRAIAVDSSGNVYLNGSQASDSYGGYDYGVVKLDTNGNLLWQKKIGGKSSDTGYAIAVDSSGNVYLNGEQSSDSYGAGDYGVVKLDTNGNLLWQKKIGGAYYEVGYAIAVDSSGNVYLNGCQTSDSYGGSRDYGVIKMSGTQTSDMNLSVGNMNLSVGNMNLSVENMNLSVENMNLSVENMNLPIGNSTLNGVSSSGTPGGLKYIGN